MPLSQTLSAINPQLLKIGILTLLLFVMSYIMTKNAMTHLLFQNYFLQVLFKLVNHRSLAPIRNQQLFLNA